MPKPSEDVQDLKRRFARLARLDGRPLACAEGLVLFEPLEVRDPRPLLRACEAGPPPIAAVTASLSLGSPPLVLTVSLVAAAQRDLRILEEPRTRATLREEPRLFRRHGDLDDAWIERRRASVGRLAERLRAAAEPVSWFARALDAIGVAHGEDAAAVVVHAAAGVRGTARARERAARFFAGHALAFDPRPRWGGELSLPAREIERRAEALDDTLHRFGRTALRLDEVVALGTLDLGDVGPAVARLVAAGLPVEDVRRLAALGRAKDLAVLDGDPETAAAYASFACALVPHYAALGLEVPLTPEVFERLRKGTRKEDLAVLAVCLMKHHSTASADTAQEALARLDATVGLFARRPAEAASILADLSGTSPGAGREALPDVAAWLGDDALLDRYVHLARLAGAPVALSRSLRADLARNLRIEGERAHLAAVPDRTPEQDERLRRLVAGEVAPPDPAKTRRRLESRLGELTAAAYQRRLDDLFRRIVKQVWGISLSRITPAWRDAIRFYLAVDDNRELYGTVLRAAAAGADLAHALPRNRAWIEEAKGRFDVEAWLSPRAREVTIGGRVHRLAVEQDPIEVLRMGIPFDTCLSLEGGSNAASTVVNAADANKRVIYLRDARETIVARKLTAVSAEGTLVGYRLYVAAREHEAEIAAAFQSFCQELGEAARLPLAADGKPLQIHPGFWYDDGTAPFDAPPEDAPVKAYCLSLGLTPPAVPDDRLRDAARLFGALRREDRAAVTTALRARWRGIGVEARAAAWLLGQLEAREVVAEARRSSVLALAAMARASEQGPPAMLDLAGRVADTATASDALHRISRLPPSAAMAAALLDAALATRAQGGENDGHGLEHRALDLLPELLGALPVAAALPLCDRAEPIFRWLAAHGCADCAVGREHQLLEAIAVAYASQRDPDAVIRCLGSARGSVLASRAALRIAARYALGGDVLPPLPPPRLQPLHPSPAALRALDKLRGRAPDLDAEPDMLAAVLRQSAGAPRAGKLPVPREAPFESLGDLLVQLDLAEVVAPFTRSLEPILAWRPGPWELYHHRRHRTERRAALAAEVLRVSPPPPEACALLARLGDAAALAAVQRVTPPHTRNHAASKVAPARRVAAQVQACSAPDPLAVAVVDPSAFEEEIDAGLVLAAFDRIERFLAGGGGDPSLAFSIALRDQVPERVTRRVSAALAAGGALEGAAGAFISLFLRRRTRTYGPEHASWLAAAFGSIGPLCGDLAVALVRCDELGASFAAADAALARAGQGGVSDDLLLAWILALSDDGSIHQLDDLVDEALFRRIVRLILGAGRAALLVALYCSVGAPEQAAIVLAELGRSPLRTSAAMIQALEGAEAWMAKPENAVPAGWLRACVDGA